MDVIFDDADEAMAAAALLKRFGIDAVHGPFGRQVPAFDDEPPHYEWRVTAFGMVGGLYESAEHDEAEDYIESEWDRAALNRELRDGYKRDGTYYDY